MYVHTHYSEPFPFKIPLWPLDSEKETVEKNLHNVLIM
jgi:hypothetical protein